jgi:histidinol phosphatase-like enzyme
MQKTRKGKYIAAVALILGLSTIGYGAHAAGTAQTGTNGVNPMTGLVTALSQRFNLNATDVQKVFDEQHAQMEAAHQAQEKIALQQAVTDGKLTQAQADLITAKRAELETARLSLEGKTKEERDALMKTQMDALKQWATTNNIPVGYVFGFGHGDHGGRHGDFKGPQTTTTQ